MYVYIYIYIYIYYIYIYIYYIYTSGPRGAGGYFGCAAHADSTHARGRPHDRSGIPGLHDKISA